MKQIKALVFKFIGLSCLLLMTHSFAAELKQLKVTEEQQATILNFSVTGSFRYKAFVLKKPERAVIDFYHTRSAINLEASVKNNQLIKTVRSGHPNARTLRIVLDLNHPIQLTASKDANQLKVQLKSQGKQASAPTKKTSSSPYMVSNSPSKSLREVVVIIDPGHGGKDPGAIGPTRHLEKTVVLAIAKKLKQIIDKQPGMRAVLTRSGDYYISLRERLNIARKHDADIFISIHADAFKNKNSNGASVFALSQTGATSEAARWLAEKENYSELGGVDLSELDDQNGVIRSVLIDLSQTATIGASLKIGERVLDSLDDMTRLHNKAVEQARFVVLKSPDIPSILIETGFISNPREERSLTSSWYQTRLAQAVFKGVKQYFFEHPPHGTLIEAMVTTQKHLVKRGETLGGIAAKYNTSVSQLKMLNQLKSDNLIVGQQLILPKRFS